MTHPPVSPQNPATNPPATFGLRALAKLADLLVLSALQLVLVSFLALLDAFNLVGVRMLWAFLAGYLLLAVGYFAFFSSRGRQTWGYRLAGLEVVGEEGEAVGGWRSLGRAVLNFVSLSTLQYLIGLFDYLPVALTQSKRAVHDLLTRTAVICVASPQPAFLAAATVASIAAPFIIVFAIVRPLMLQAFYIPSPSMAPTIRVDDRFLANRLVYRLHPIRRGDIVVFVAPEKVMAGRPDFIKRVIGVPGDVIEAARGRVVVNGQEFNHQSVRDALGHAGLFGQEAQAGAEVSQAQHHVKFVPQGVFADGRFVPQAQLAELLTGRAAKSVAVTPGYVQRNGRRLEEPYTAEDPDYDLQMFRGQALTHRQDSESGGEEYEQSGQAISQADYDRDRTTPAERVPAGQLLLLGDNRNDSNDGAFWGYLPVANVEGKVTLLFSPSVRRL